jgi:hypothetical protein
VLIFASLGALFLAVEVYALVAWFVSGNATPTPTGPTHFPAWQNVVLQTWQWGGLAALAIFVYFIVVRPWRRSGRITLDGLLVLCFAALSWIDCMANYLVTWTTYNSHFVNLGSFYSEVPGWLSPNAQRIAYPILWLPPVYVYLVFGLVLVVCSLMRRLQNRWPNRSHISIIVVLWVSVSCFDAILEPLAIRAGLYSYGGTIRWLSFLGFPIYGAMGFGAAVVGWACLRTFSDKNGYTLAERGIDEVRTNRPTKVALRGLGLYGLTTAIFLGFYTLPSSLLALHGGPWPKDVVARSYLTDGLCGPGTSYACSSPAIPIPRPHSSHLSPDNQLVPHDR